ncbi:MAG: hypothetical protein PVF68_10970 [Acidobacteriota bacterium]
MTTTLPSDHPLFTLFRDIGRKNLLGVVGIRRPEVADYVCDMMIRFAHVDEIRRVRDLAGRPLEDVGEMLEAADRAAAIPRGQSMRDVRRHIGDFTLFFLGMFPEWVARHATTRLPGVYVDWSSEGKRSYRIVSEFRSAPFEDEAPLFAALADAYDFCVVGLNLIRNDLRQLTDPRYAWLRAALDE